MKNTFLILLLISTSSFLPAQGVEGYQSLDKENPIYFGGSYLIYKGKKIELDENNFFVDGQLSDAEVLNYPFVFNSINEAIKTLEDGTPEKQMTLYLAPYVYWVDNPDDLGVRKPLTGDTPYGVEVTCNWLKIFGLTDQPQNVVLASNRGQTQGAVGNFTMFHFIGDGLCVENLTMGNYCNVDLNFPLLSKLNRKKRAAAIVQAQLAICEGDKIVARNSRFISRLNSCPLVGGRRVLFHQCYFECTDDALCGTGVFLDCRLTLLSSKPFYSTQGTGAVFLNCDFDVQTKQKQYLTKVGSPVAIVDSRFFTSDPLHVAWTQDPTDDLRSYQYNVSLNGKPLLISADKPWLTVDMKGKQLLNAYRIVYKGKVVYNTYNLLRGDDEWDPMGVKHAVLAASKLINRDLSKIPTMLRISPRNFEIESGVSRVKLNAEVKRFSSLMHKNEDISWSLSPESRSFVKLIELKDTSCEVIGTNENDETKKVVVVASTLSGLESASVLTVSPRYLMAPEFITLPKIVMKEKGLLYVDYTLSIGDRADESLVTWYRCKDAKGTGAVPVSVSRLNKPQRVYNLSLADAGYYIMVTVSPKHLRCHAGKEEKAITSVPILEEAMLEKSYYTDFQNFPVTYQPDILPGFWKIDAYKPLDTQEYKWEPNAINAWKYGRGVDGAKGTGLLQATKGARLLYTPARRECNDMSVVLNVDPCKTAGQGFGSATGQYMDIYIKFDSKTLSGYALRIIRTTKFDKAVDFVLMKYDKGIAVPISDSVSSTCFRTNCTIMLSVVNNLMKVHVETSANSIELSHSGLKPQVDLQANIVSNVFGGTGVLNTGSVGGSAIMLHWIKIEWKD
ncbi:hypothetical protein [Bacteroides ihuae]|uniref:hypothetical protein n=1 Tax=Bacteroides ihuae TaxID=1852362 RepID=UPI0008D93061|nr:hypothetical protein [Bacteroides ihuae]